MGSRGNEVPIFNFYEYIFNTLKDVLFLWIGWKKDQRLLLKCCSFSISVYHAIYLEEMVASEVARKLALVFNIPFHQINQVYRQGPTGIHIIVSDQVTWTAKSICVPFHNGVYFQLSLKSYRKVCGLLQVLMRIIFKELGIKICKNL